MESEFSPDQEKGEPVPPVPIKTYQWEDLRRAREAGGYPWTHLLKVPLEGEITAEDIIRETTPRRSMSREVSRSRTRSPDGDVQRILNLDSSPGSSRRHGEEGEDEGVHIPNFSKEVSLDADDDVNISENSKPQASALLVAPVEIPKNVSPKGILKRRVPEPQYNIGVTETREKTKCCHPLVNKIKHLADKTLQKLEKSENEKSPISKRKKNDDNQEIRQLKSSPGAVRRQKFSAIKLGDSDEMSKTMSVETPPPRKKKEHIYEDIEEARGQDLEKNLKFLPDLDKQGIKLNHDSRSNSNKENESLSNIEKKSIASQDPSLVTEETQLGTKDHVMEMLHKMDNVNNEAVLLDDEMDPDEPNVDEIFQNQLDERGPHNESPNITITEITDDDAEGQGDQQHAPPIESSPSPSPRDIGRQSDFELANRQWSKPSSDHEYEIIEKPPPNIIYTAPSIDEKPTMVKTDDELSSTTSLERKYLQHASDDEEPAYDKDNIHHDHDGISTAEELQKNIEDRFFANTPSTPSRTECEVSTSQVDSSALEQLPLKRDSRTESKIQKRIKEGTGKLKTQAGKLKTKLQNIKANKISMPERSKITSPDRPKFKMPDRPKFNFPQRPQFSMPDRRKFSLPDRPKFKKINISEKLNFGDRKKFTLPERPRFNVPDMPKFRMPERPKINFPSLGRKSKVQNQEYQIETNAGSSIEIETAAVDFEPRTYPRWFGKKKKSEIPKTSSSPTLNREDTPPPTFTFTRVNKKTTEQPSTFIPDSPEEPREYGNSSTRTASNDDIHYNEGNNTENRKQFETTYDFDTLPPEYMDDDRDPDENHHHTSNPDISPSNLDHTPVITQINNDEFFVRPRGISRENIQVREYLSDETRQAFKTPKNVLALMGSSSEVNDDMYLNDPEVDPEYIDENEQMRYSTEDLNDKDDGYYTFPPVRPSRAKRKKKPVLEAEQEPTPYIDESTDPSMHFTEIDLGLQEEQLQKEHSADLTLPDNQQNDFMNGDSHLHFTNTTDLQSIHEYANDDVIQYPENVPIQSQTLPMPPRRKKKFGKKDLHSSLSDFKRVPVEELWEEPRDHDHADDIIVYRTEHEYMVPQGEPAAVGEASPVAPRRTRSRSSRATSLCDDDRTSHGADSLTLDSHLPPTEDLGSHRDIRHESPGYATVDKGSHAPPKAIRRSVSKTPPVRRRKSNSSERKYYTVGSTNNGLPDRPPRKKSFTSLMTLDSFTKHSDITPYVDIDDEPFEEVHKDLQSGDVVSKMKDRPLPPPPRPPRGSRKKKKDKSLNESICPSTEYSVEMSQACPQEPTKAEDVVEIEVSTQTDPLPDDVEFELGLDENLDISMSSSLRDIVDEESILLQSHSRISESPRFSRPTSRSERSVKLTDQKITDLSKSNVGRSSPTVILVERRVSSPTRINERQEMLTEASLTVQHIDIDESQIPDVPPLPKPRGISSTGRSSKNIAPSNDERALERMADANREVHLDNLVTQRLQVRDLDVGRLNVSELQANKILVSDIEGMTLQVAELDSKAGHICVSGIEFSQNVIDEIVKKFTEISTSAASAPLVAPINENVVTPEVVVQKPVHMEEETQTEYTEPMVETRMEANTASEASKSSLPPPELESQPPMSPTEDPQAPQRPPPPGMNPLIYMMQDMPMPPQHLSAMFSRPLSSLYSSRFSCGPFQFRQDQPAGECQESDSHLEQAEYQEQAHSQMPPQWFPEGNLEQAYRQMPTHRYTDYQEPAHQQMPPPPPARRVKRRAVVPRQSESSSDEADRVRPSPRKMPPPARAHEPTIAEVGAQFLRVCHSSITRTIRNMFNAFMSYISGTEDKRDVQMALVIFLVLVAGLIMFGLSDSRAIHHHHWEFFNPPDGNQ